MERSYILYLGGSGTAKGWPLVRKLARLMPEFTFLCAGFKKEEVKKNIIFKKRLHEQSLFFNFMNSYVLLVPSQQPEAYGRVSVEAQNAGCPVLVSNTGGLPETLKKSTPYSRALNSDIVYDYQNPRAWREKILTIINKQKGGLQ